MVSIVAGGVVGAMTLFLGMLAFGGDRFDGGVGYGGQVADRYIDNRIAIEGLKKGTDEKFDLLIKKIDKILAPDNEAAKPIERSQ